MLKKLLLTLVLGLLLSSCSNTPQTTTSAQPFVVGMECNYAPFNWLENDESEGAVFVESTNGYCKGYDVTVASHLASELGRPLEIKAIAWEGLIPALNSGNIDAIIAGMSYTADRATQVNFTEPYYYSDYVMLVPADSELAQATSLADFSGHRIVGQMGTNYDTIINQIDGVEHLPALNTYPLIVNALNSGTADGAPAEKPTAQAIVATNPELVIVEFEQGQGFTQTEDVTTEVSIALRKEDTQLLEDVNRILETITQDQRDSWMQQAIESPQE